MSCMIDKYHDRYHSDTPDYVNCPYCQDDLIAAETASMTDDQYRAFVDEQLRTNGTELPLPVVGFKAEIDWGPWLEDTYDPDNERLEDKEV